MSAVVKKDDLLPSQQTQPDYRRVPQTYHDGKSPAAWAGSMGTLAGFVVMAVGFLMMSVPVIIASFVIIAVALVATIAMRAMGYGEAIGYDGRPRS